MERTPRIPRRGFTLAELLISLAVMAMLLTAAALAMYGAGASHSYNAQKLDLVAQTRGVLDRLARDVCRAESCQVVNSRTLAITMPDGSTRTYAWNGEAGGTLTLTVADDGTTSATLASGVQGFEVVQDEPAVCARLSLRGTEAETETSVTSTPRRAVF